MKIAIVTQPLGPNLGGIVQNWALQQALKKLGHSPVTINYVNFESVDIAKRLRIFARNVRTLIKRIGGDYNRLYRPSDNLPNAANISFIHDNIDLTPRCDVYSPLNGAEAYIVGSDQVWRPRYNKAVLADCYLKFTGNLPVRRIAYAASFGTDRWEYTTEQTRECSALLKRFDAVSVRESGAIELCRKYLGCDAQLTSDPTMLLCADEYLKICAPRPLSDEYIASYFLDYNRDKRNIFKTAGRHCRSVDINPHRASVPQWLGTIANAKAVVTDSFHGAVFSIIFRRPFVVVANPDRGNSRMETLLAELNMADRLVYNPSQASEILSKDIDWDSVEAAIVSRRQQSIAFLTQALK